MGTRMGSVRSTQVSVGKVNMGKVSICKDSMGISMAKGTSMGKVSMTKSRITK